MEDAHGAMLDVAIELIQKEASGQRLSSREQVIVDIAWIDIQTAPNGFLGWLSYTSSERMLRTLAALRTINCSRVLALVEKALQIAAIDPTTMSDEDRQVRLESLSEADACRLYLLDGEFYDAVDDCMGCLRHYARAEHAKPQGFEA